MKEENIQLETRTTTPNKPAKGRHKLLRDDPEVDRWYRNLDQGSHNTASVRLRRLGLFCEEVHTTPRKLASMRPKQVTELLEDWKNRKLGEETYERDGQRMKYQADYVKTSIVAVKSWLDHMGVRLVRDVRVSGADISRVQQEEMIPPEDVARMLSLGSLKARTVKQLMAKRGLRPGVIGNAKGTDGLKLADLPDLVIPTSGPVSFSARPPRLVIRPELSKTRLRCEGFMTNELAKAVLAYLNDRLSRGETLNRESPLIATAATVSRRFAPKRFMTSAAVSKEVRESNRPTYTQRPYALRVFNEQSLLTAESRAGVPEVYRKYWVNHKGGIEARYTVNRPLPPDVVAEMRAAFLKAEPFLDVEVGREAEREKLLRKVQAALPGAGEEALAEALKIIRGKP